jgi:hypothetical protein
MRRVTFRPGIVALESRAVPTVVSPFAFGGAGLKVQQATSEAAALVSPAATGANNGLTFNPNPTIDPTKLSKLGLATARFAVSVSGPYSLARSYYADVDKQIIYLGQFSGTTGQMRHGQMVMRVVIPADSSTPIQGIAVLRDRSVTSSGIQLVLDLTATATDSQGRPTAFTWQVDATSAGSYTNAPGNGTLSLFYKANGNSKFSVGGYSAVFSGMILPDPTLLNTVYDIPKIA